VLPLDICSTVLNVVANLVQDGISLPEKSESLQGLLLDLLLIHLKRLVNSILVIGPAALPVDVALLHTFPFSLLLSFPCHVTMPGISSSLLGHGSPRIKDRPFPGLVQPWEVSHVDGGSIPVAHELHLIPRPS
jgi:hypothetical protein